MAWAETYVASMSNNTSAAVSNSRKKNKSWSDGSQSAVRSEHEGAVFQGIVAQKDAVKLCLEVSFQ